MQIMKIIDISAKVILPKVTRKLGFPNPIYRIKVSEGLYVRSFVEVTVNGEISTIRLSKQLVLLR